MTMNAARPGGINAVWKVLMLLAFSLVVAAITHRLIGESGSDIPFEIGQVLGRTVLYAWVGIMSAFLVRGSNGVLVGVMVICVLGGSLGYVERRTRHAGESPEQSFERHRKELRDSAHKSLDKNGIYQADPALARDMFKDLSEESRNLDPKWAGAIRAAGIVGTELVAAAEAVQKILNVTETREFQSAGSIRTREDLAARLQKARELLEVSKDAVARYADLDRRFREELAKCHLTASETEYFVGKFVGGAHLEVTLPKVRLNLDYAEALIRKFSLLDAEYGAWSWRDSRVTFDHHAAAQSWAENRQQFLAISTRGRELNRRTMEIVEGKQVPPKAASPE